ncbi:MAG: glycosyltransferase family 4 protein, partial [Actinobacteria bacterium]|nr:glycosyltransferase family 4 protein [Actinomycetota bacterium]
MNIILINHYAGGMKFGMEFRPYYFARRWVEMGHNITIVASSFSHLRNKNPDMEGKNYKEEDVDGIRYVWIAGNPYHGNGLGRIRNMFSFLRGLYAHKKKIIGKDIPDVVIASSTYPLDFYPARNIARLCGAKVVFELHDLWPLSPM